MEKDLIKQHSEISLKLQSQSSINKFEDVEQSPAQSIALLRKEYGDEKIMAVVILLICDLADFFNVGNQISDQQIKNTAELICTEYFYLKVDDFTLCFKRGKLGYYGKGANYNRFDGAIIFDWMKQYVNERAEYFAGKNISAGRSNSVFKDDKIDMAKVYEKEKQKAAEEAEHRKHKELIRELRRQAVSLYWQAKDEYFKDLIFTDTDAEQKAHEDYLLKNPCNESYIKFTVKKLLDEHSKK